MPPVKTPKELALIGPKDVEGLAGDSPGASNGRSTYGESGTGETESTEDAGGGSAGDEGGGRDGGAPGEEQQ